ncbi:MAG: MBL fold metallo-hydrolase [Candidatus Thorarchaeota archaeon]
MLKYKGKKITWLGHDGFKWESDGKMVIIDPFKLTGNPGEADIVITSHEHFV